MKSNAFSIPLFVYPEYNSAYSYWSLVTSCLFAIILTYISISGVCKDTYLLFLFGMVTVLSIVHHTRAYEQEYTDLIRYVDIFFAVSLGIYLVCTNYQDYMIYVFVALIGICFYFIHTIDIPHVQSKIHAIAHVIAILFVLYCVQLSQKVIPPLNR